MSDYRSIPPPEPNEEFATVVRTHDATEGEMMVQVLRDHDIECRLIGTRNAALIGVGSPATALRIEVIESHVKAARELLAELRAATTDDDEDIERPRRPMMAVGSVILFFGGGHLYARRPWTTAVLAFTQISTLLLPWPWPGEQIKWGTIPSVLLLDAVMGARAASAYNRGVRPSPLRQALVGLLWAVAAAIVGVLYALRAAR
jgi:hypothetical protein